MPLTLKNLGGAQTDPKIFKPMLQRAPNPLSRGRQAEHQHPYTLWHRCGTAGTRWAPVQPLPWPKSPGRQLALDAPLACAAITSATSSTLLANRGSSWPVMGSMSLARREGVRYASLQPLATLQDSLEGLGRPRCGFYSTCQGPRWARSYSLRGGLNHIMLIAVGQACLFSSLKPNLRFITPASPKLAITAKSGAHTKAAFINKLRALFGQFARLARPLAIR